jgi:hypothetical protein
MRQRTISSGLITEVICFVYFQNSLRNDVDLMHYNAQSEQDLKKIYDKVMNQDISMNRNEI